MLVVVQVRRRVIIRPETARTKEHTDFGICICRHVFPLDRDGFLQISMVLQFFVMFLRDFVTVFRTWHFGNRC